METVLQATGIVKKYGANTVLKGINMEINKGDIYGFIGKNGAGKTTFMRVALSLARSDGGEVKFFDGKTIEEVGLKVGSLIESPGLCKNLTAYENLKRFSILYQADESKINDLLKLVGLEGTANKKVKNFSLGMKQRLGIAVALIGDPEFLLLDEPINGLDPEGIKEIRDLIVKLNKEKGITFLISSHLLDELSKIVTKYGIINNGTLIEEVEASELREKCKNKVIFECDDTNKAFEVISKTVPIDDIKVEKNKIAIYSHLKDAPEINKELVKTGVTVLSFYTNIETLEEYFMERIGN